MTSGLLYPWYRHCGEEVEVVFVLTSHGIEVRSVKNAMGHDVELSAGEMNDLCVDIEAERVIGEAA